LSIAVKKGNESITKLLIKAGADVNAQNNVNNYLGRAKFSVSGKLVWTLRCT